MPQASQELRDQWDSDHEALDYLASQGVKEVINGVLAFKASQDKDRVNSAVNYLVNEWDYGFTTILENDS